MDARSEQVTFKAQCRDNWNTCYGSTSNTATAGSTNCMYVLRETASILLYGL